MNLLKTGLMALAFICLTTSCEKEEGVTNNELNYTINLDLAHQTDWEMANAILDLVNDHRKSIGLPTLKKDQRYASAYAVDHTQYMIDMAQVNHDNFAVRANALKEQGASLVGENVAYGFETAEDVVHAWLRSSGHKAIIEGNYTHSGFGVMQNEKGNYYFTQLFYRK